MGEVGKEIIWIGVDGERDQKLEIPVSHLIPMPSRNWVYKSGVHETAKLAFKIFFHIDFAKFLLYLLYNKF